MMYRQQSLRIGFLLAIAALLAAVAAPTMAQNDYGVYIVDAEHPWPAESPYPSATAAEVVNCQTSEGVYDEETTRWFNVDTQQTYRQMVDFCLTGTIWFKDGFKLYVVVENPKVPAGFCSNQQPYWVNGENPWPSQDPCDGDATFEVVLCEYEVGVWDDENVRYFPSFEEAHEGCYSGGVWARPIPNTVLIPFVVR